MSEVFRQEHAAGALSEPADTRIERLHRYYLARELARGRDVLDLRGTDGAGPALLAQTARHVVALVEPGAAGGFAADNLELRESGAPDADRFDLVLAFDMLEQQDDPEAFLAMLRGLVRPEGCVLLATPDRGGMPAAGGLTARREYDAATVAGLLGRHFAQTRLVGQRVLVGSVMRGDAAPALVVEHRGSVQVETGSALRAGSVCVLASAADIALPDSIFIDAGMERLARSQALLLQAESERVVLQQAQAKLEQEAGRRRRSDADWRHELAVLRVNEAAARTAQAEAGSRHEAAERQYLSVLAEVQAAEQARAASHAAAAHAQWQRAEALEAELVRLRDLLALPVPSTTQRIRRRLRRVLPGGGGRLRVIRGSALFDAGWYRAHYPDIGRAGIDPAVHYLRNGAAERRDPGPDFDAGWVLEQYGTAIPAGVTPLEQYELTGRGAGWQTTRPMAAPVSTPVVVVAPAPKPNPRILFVSGESGTPGSQYRCVRYAEAAREAGWDAGWSKLEETGAIELIGVEVAVLWRVQYSRHVAGVIREIRQSGGTVVFDVDDLMIRPELARTSVIDGIRTTNAGIGSTRETFALVQQAMAAADLCSTTTEELAEHMRAFQKATYILPNGFDDATHARSRLAVRRQATGAADELIRIGYAAGTLTHQKDFLTALPGLLQVLEAREKVRLVLFRVKGGPELVVVDEFEALARFADRIEWRDKVELEGLPEEIARFDINIAPLELGNPFCEAKSELKYFEAALVDVPTVASPTGPFARVIAPGRNGLLAADDAAWHECLLRLVDDAGLRRQMGRRAYLDCLWQFGPRRRAELVDGFLQQISGSVAGARAFALDVGLARDARPARFDLSAVEVLFRRDRMGEARVTVVIPCFNYADYVIEALESVRLQSLALLDLVVVDDCSTDPLATELILEWCRTHAARFNRLVVLRHVENAGLSAARNTGFAAAETDFVMPLDADNRLHAACCAVLLDCLTQHRAAYAYPSVKMFGAADSVFCNERYQPMRFVGGNYIDAMAMIAKWAWAAAGGYDMPRTMGWEDFDLWCRLAELGQRGIHVPQVLADYRVHGGSMVASMVEVDENKQQMVALTEQRHDWLRLTSRKPRERI